MNTKRLYIADYCKVTGTDKLNLRFERIKYILVKSNLFHKAILQEVDSKNKYQYNIYSSYCKGASCINHHKIRPFNYVTGNRKKYLSKKKVLILYKKAIEELEVKHEKKI